MQGKIWGVLNKDSDRECDFLGKDINELKDKCTNNDKDECRVLAEGLLLSIIIALSFTLLAAIC